MTMTTAPAEGSTIERFTPVDKALLHDPYPTYQRYREADPVHWGYATMPALPGSWYLFEYAHNRAMLLDNTTFASDPATVGMAAAIPPAFAPIATIFQRWLGGMDPPDHARLRAIMAKAFTPRRVAEMQPRIREITQNLVATALERGDGRINIIADVSFPLPMSVIGAAVGVPSEDWAQFDAWGKDVADAVDKPGDEEAGKAGAAAISGMFDYFQRIVVARRSHRNDDLLSAMVDAVDDDGHPMNEFDAIAIAVELGFAGHETTANGVARSILALMDQRDRFEELKALPEERWDDAVEELMRITTPVQRQRWRWATKDTEIGGKAISRGESVVSILGAANRDPAVFSNPDRIDFDRPLGRHLTFGVGAHYCIGHALARFEVKAALQSLLAGVPDMQLAQPVEEIHWHENYLLPGPHELWVTTS